MEISDNVSKLSLQNDEQAADKATGSSANSQTPSVAKIQQLLESKNDTTRFLGLALLKSTLDTSTELLNDEDVVASLWGSISPKFLDRLLRTGSKPGAKQKNAKEMLDIAAAVIFAFTVLLPVAARSEPKLVGRIPLLIEAIAERYRPSILT